MKKLLCIITLACALFSQEILKIGTSPGYAPFEYMKDDKLVGFDIDLVSEAAKLLGKKIEFKTMDFDGLIMALKGGKIDIIASGMSETPARAKSVAFTKPYYISSNLYVKNKNNTKLNSLSDLAKGAILGAQLGTIQADEISKIKGVKAFLNSEHMPFVLATLTGKIDGFVLENAVAKKYLDQYSDLEIFGTSEIQGGGVALAFRKNQKDLAAEFDKAIDELKNNGTFDKLLKKYNLF